MKPYVTDVEVLHEGAVGAQNEFSGFEVHPKLTMLASETDKPEDGNGMQGYPKGSEEPTGMYETAAKVVNDAMPKLDNN